MSDSQLLPKLLSHRLRGFAPLENSPSGMREACGSRVRFLEIDTRVSVDGEIYVYHDPWIRDGKIPLLHFPTSTAAEIDEFRFDGDEPVLSLDDCLGIFSETSGPEQVLCIDIKDFGFEAEHLELVRQHGVEDRVAWVSWIAPTLVELSKAGTSAPLVFSHWNLQHRGLFGRFLSGAVALVRFARFSVAGHGSLRATTHPGRSAQGFNHVSVFYRLPAMLVDVLKSSGGGVCIPTHQASESFCEYCHKNDLQVWVFSVDDAQGFREFAGRGDIDVVFCDNVPLVFDELSVAD